MNRKETIAIIIDTLQPNMVEYADNTQFHYWMDYACELDNIMLLAYQDDLEPLIEHLNSVIASKLELTPQHHACVDVATSLESQIEGFKGRFTYV